MVSATDFTEADQQIIKEVTALAHQRLRGRTAQVTAAVQDFENNADAHISDQLQGLTGNAQFTFGTVVDSLLGIVGSVLVPEVAVGKAILDEAKNLFITGLKEAVVGAEQNGSDAVERLNHAIKALSYQISNREGVANAHLETLLEDVVLNNFDQYGEPQHNEHWIAWVCDQMGFTDASRDLVYDPVRQWLEYEFIGLLTTVRGELLLAHGHDSSQIHPRQWGLEAQRAEREQYEQHKGPEREQAWEDPYKLH
jgi:hypothetical protein